MNDLDVVHDFAPDVPLPWLTELAMARERVVAGIAGRRSERGPARRIAFGGVTVAAAAAITAGVMLVGGTHAVVAVPAQLTGLHGGDWRGGVGGGADLAVGGWDPERA